MSIPVLRPPSPGGEATIVDMDLPVIRPPGQGPEPGGEGTQVMNMPVIPLPSDAATAPATAPAPAMPTTPPPAPHEPAAVEVTEFDLDAAESTTTLEKPSAELGIEAPDSDYDQPEVEEEFVVARRAGSHVGANVKKALLYLVGALAAVGAIALAVAVVRDGLAN